MALSWQYIAGFFDGEGCVRIATNKSRTGCPQLSIHQADRRGLVLLEEIREFLSTHGIQGHMRTEARLTGAGKPMYRLYLSSRHSVSAFIAFVFPYLHIKKLESQDVVRYLRMFPIVPGNKVFKKPVPIRTHCTNGHDLAIVGTYPKYSHEGRMRVTCAECARIRAKERYERIVGQRERFERNCKSDPRVAGWL